MPVDLGASILLCAVATQWQPVISWGRFLGTWLRVKLVTKPSRVSGLASKLTLKWRPPEDLERNWWAMPPMGTKTLNQVCLICKTICHFFNQKYFLFQFLLVSRLNSECHKRNPLASKETSNVRKRKIIWKKIAILWKNRTVSYENCPPYEVLIMRKLEHV